MRSLLYFMARRLGDVASILSGRFLTRLLRRRAGRVVGGFLDRLFR